MLEVVIFSLGTTVVKSACKIWLGDSEWAGDAASDLVDVFAGQLSNYFDLRRAARFVEQCAEIVARKLSAVLSTEFRNVPANEREAAVLAVNTTFTRARLNDAALFKANLDARLVERQLRPAADAVLRDALLSEGSREIYSLVLRESCAYLVEVVTALPRFTSNAVIEVLRRETTVLETLTQLLEHLPERRGVEDFAADYRRAVMKRLDRMELLGVSLARTNPRYPLSVAYIDLSTLRRPGRSGRLVTRSEPEAGDLLAGSGGLAAEETFGRGRRALVIGQAGSGKTTLLRWLAVRSAAGDFAGSLSAWNGTVPFFIPLRRYVNGSLPRPEQFPLAVAENIVDEMPNGWVHRLLREGRALVLVDGVDEMPEGQRDGVRTWLEGLITDFDKALYVVTSRPAAVDEGWLDKLGFAATELQPMSAALAAKFIHQWHEAMNAELLEASEHQTRAGYEQSLVAAIDADRHLRALTVSPLLCALLCALHWDLLTQLPHDLMEIYDAALGMLLERRDQARRVETDEIQLTRTEKTLLLQDVAFWLVRNGWSDAPESRVVEQVGRSLTQLHKVSAGPEAVFRSLLERTGVLREPAEGRVDFVHRTFQEYLAGKAAVDHDDIRLLINHAHDDQWREVVVMAAGHASADQCAELLRGLLRNARKRAYSGRLRPLAVACMQTARRLDPQLCAEIDRVAGQLVPPTTSDDAEALASGGEMVLDLLQANPPRTPAEGAASIQAVARIGGERAPRLIAEILARYAEPPDPQVDRAVIDAWRFFKPDQYAKEVLARSWPPNRELPVPDLALVNELHVFTELTAVKCELKNYRTGVSSMDLSPLTRISKLRSVTLVGCRAELGLTSLLQLSALESIELISPYQPPELAALAPIPRPWKLTLACRFCGNCLQSLAGFQALSRLTLRGCDDLMDLKTLPRRPAPLQALSLYGFSSLRSLDGIERWDGLQSVELFECPQITDLTPLAALTSLQQISLGLFSGESASYSPLSKLPELKELFLMGHNVFDVSGLAGMPNLSITIPAKTRLIGADELSPSTSVTEYQADDSVHGS